MSENLKNDPSEWKVGESNPAEFTAAAVVKVLENTDEDETERIGDAEFNGDGAGKRDTVGKAASDRAKELADEVSGDEESDNSDEEWDAEVDDDYDPFSDPDVPSTVIAQTIATELEGGNGSPTLNAVRGAKSSE